MEHRRYRLILSKYKYKLFNLNHVIGIGYGKKERRGRTTDEDSIVVMVDKKIPKKKLPEKDVVPQTIENTKTDVIELGKIELLSRKGKVRPVQPGISVGHYKITAGTLGAIVKDIKTGEPLILSNNHVLANQTNGFDKRAKIGDPILQPATYDNGDVNNDVIGYLERFIPLKSNVEEATCPVALGIERMVNDFLHSFRPDYNFKLYKQGVTNLVDCAVAKPINKELVNEEILGIGKVKGITEPQLGMKVIKSGRTTGVTRGKIKAIETTLEVNMEDNKKALFEDQIILEPISDGGDSGSLVLDENNKAVGLLFAGSNQATVCNRITNVLKALKIKL